MTSWRSNAIATAPMPNGLSSGSMTESMTSAYAELHCHSNYSFLEGASHPEELVARARDLEMPALAITDRNGLYGAVKFFGAAERAGIQPIVGTELTIDDDRLDAGPLRDRKSTRLNSSHRTISYAVFCLKKKKKKEKTFNLNT